MYVIIVLSSLDPTRAQGTMGCSYSLRALGVEGGRKGGESDQGWWNGPVIVVHMWSTCQCD